MKNQAAEMSFYCRKHRNLSFTLCFNFIIPLKLRLLRYYLNNFVNNPPKSNMY